MSIRRSAPVVSAAKWYAAASLAVAAFYIAPPALSATCCPGFTQQCAGAKSIWCVQNGAPAGTLPTAFCAYGDNVVTELESLFNIPAPDTFEFDVEWPANGGAHTGTACSTFGDGVTGDAFTNNSYNVTGFYGYLLALHEAINDWTGLSTPGWPTDYWADHVSGFPNEMDWRIMGTLGAKLGDSNLTAASVAQKRRFWPGGDSEDSRVQMFDSIFSLPNMGNGYDGFKRIFAYIQADGLSWDDVAQGRANPDKRRSEYVAAYLSLGAGQSVLGIEQHPAAGYSSSTSWAVCNGQWDGQSGDPNPSYTCTQADIDAIATAHCSVAANGRPSADMTSLRSGDYPSVKPGPCGSTCPGECACDSVTNRCVAAWLGTTSTADAGGARDAAADATLPVPVPPSGQDAGGDGGRDAGGGAGPRPDGGRAGADAAAAPSDAGSLVDGSVDGGAAPPFAGGGSAKGGCAIAAAGRDRSLAAGPFGLLGAVSAILSLVRARKRRW